MLYAREIFLDIITILLFATGGLLIAKTMYPLEFFNFGIFLLAASLVNLAKRYNQRKENNKILSKYK